MSLIWEPIAIQYAIYTSVMWKYEAPSAHTDEALYSAVRDILYPAVQLLKLNIFA